MAKDKFLDDLPDIGQGEQEDKRKEQQREKNQKNPPGENMVEPDVVIYQPVRCPKCQTKAPYFSKWGRIRYHKCPNCGHRFKSVEK